MTTQPRLPAALILFNNLYDRVVGLEILNTFHDKYPLTLNLITMSEHNVAEEFYYDPLSAPASLRLLEILPQRSNGRIQVRLWETTEAVAYRCLSYMWGDQAARFPILVNGRQMSIGHGLYTFLEVAQDRFSKESLWIDAVCINQDDNKEKSSQVQRMGKIFSNAIEVLVWLGNSQTIAELFSWTNRPLTAVEKTVDLLHIERVPKHIREAAHELSQHPYWSRAWITQEIVLSQALRFLCDFSETTPEGIRRCVTPLRPKMAECRTWVLEQFIFPQAVWLAKAFRLLGGAYKTAPPERLKRCTATLYHKFVVDKKKIFAFDDILGLFLEQRDAPGMFWYLAWRRRNAQCQDPRDRLYSLLALTGRDESFRVDYGETVVDLYIRGLHFFFPWSIWDMANLWMLLGMSPAIITDHVQSTGKSLQLVLPMDSSRIRETARRVPKTLSRTQIGWCASCYFSIKDFACEDVLLCPTSHDWRPNFSNIHFLLQRSAPGATTQFLISMHANVRHPMLCPSDTEIWILDNGSERKVESWVDLFERTGPVLGEFEGTEARARFSIKLSHRYIIDSISHYNSWFLEGYRV